MQKHSQHKNDEHTQFLRKIYLSLYSKGLRKGYFVRGELENERRPHHIDLASLLAIAAFLSRSPSCSTGGLGAQPRLDLVLTPRTRTTDFKLCLHTGLYNYSWPPHLHSIQTVDSQGYPRISSTGCTCYLHRLFLIWQLGRIGGQYVTLEASLHDTYWFFNCNQLLNEDRYSECTH